jgi:hypothetical protein
MTSRRMTCRRMMSSQGRAGGVEAMHQRLHGTGQWVALSALCERSLRAASYCNTQLAHASAPSFSPAPAPLATPSSRTNTNLYQLSSGEGNAVVTQAPRHASRSVSERGPTHTRRHLSPSRVPSGVFHGT